MEPEGSLPRAQKPATCPYPQQDRSSPCPHPTSPTSILILPSHLRLVLPSGLPPPGFSIKTLYAPLLSPIRATCLAHSFLIWSPEWYLVRSKEHKAPYQNKFVKLSTTLLVERRPQGSDWRTLRPYLMDLTAWHLCNSQQSDNTTYIGRPQRSFFPS